MGEVQNLLGERKGEPEMLTYLVKFAVPRFVKSLAYRKYAIVPEPSLIKDKRI